MGCLRARTSEGAALFRAVTTSLPRCPCQNTEARSRAWAPALQQAGLNPGAQGRGWPGWGQEGGYRKTVHPRTGAKRHPRVCWSVCPEGNTNTGASPSRPCIQMSGVDSGLPQSAGLGCRVWEPQAGWGRVHTAWGKAPWRRGGSVGSPKVGGIGVDRAGVVGLCSVAREAPRRSPLAPCHLAQATPRCPGPLVHVKSGVHWWGLFPAPQLNV